MSFAYQNRLEMRTISACRHVVNKKRIRGVREQRNEVSACASRPSLRINKDRLSPVLACNYDGTKPGIPWIGDPSCLARRRGSPLSRNQFGINVTSCGINVVESRRTETARSLTRNFVVKISQEPMHR